MDANELRVAAGDLQRKISDWCSNGSRSTRPDRVAHTPVMREGGVASGGAVPRCRIVDLGAGDKVLASGKTWEDVWKQLLVLSVQAVLVGQPERVFRMGTGIYTVAAVAKFRTAPAPGLMTVTNKQTKAQTKYEGPCDQLAVQIVTEFGTICTEQALAAARP